MNIEKVIYEDGKCNIQTTVYADSEGIERCAYSGYLNKLEKDQTVSEYLAHNPGACISFDEALARIAVAEQSAFIKPWKEISEDAWMDALEVLPPQKWQTVDGVELFRMSEYTTGSITAHYARSNGRYFTANRRISDDYKTLSAEVKQLLGVNHANRT